MKFNFVNIIISITLSLLLAYGFYSIHNTENKLLLSACSFVFFITTLVYSIGLRFESPRTTTNVKVLSALFFLIGLISNIIFKFISFSAPIYVIINSIIFLVFVLIANSLIRANQ